MTSDRGSSCNEAPPDKPPLTSVNRRAALGANHYPADLAERRRLTQSSVPFDRTKAIRGEAEPARRGAMPALTIAAFGVVFGDIGTSPLYAIDQVFFGPAGVAPTREHVIGSISLAIWTITLIVAIKYAALVLRAENEGEGGVFALYGLLHPFRNARLSAGCGR